MIESRVIGKEQPTGSDDFECLFQREFSKVSTPTYELIGMSDTGDFVASNEVGNDFIPPEISFPDPFERVKAAVTEDDIEFEF